MHWLSTWFRSFPREMCRKLPHRDIPVASGQPQLYSYVVIYTCTVTLAYMFFFQLATRHAALARIQPISVSPAAPPANSHSAANVFLPVPPTPSPPAPHPVQRAMAIAHPARAHNSINAHHARPPDPCLKTGDVCPRAPRVNSLTRVLEAARVAIAAALHALQLGRTNV